MDFDRASECIDEGREAVRRQKLELGLLATTLGRFVVATPTAAEPETNG